MSPHIDSAILQALSLSRSEDDIKMTSHGGSGFTSTFRLDCHQKTELKKKDDNDANSHKEDISSSPHSSAPASSYFIKQAFSKDPSSFTMFLGEYTSLNAIHAVVPSLCPRAVAHGRLAEREGAFLVTEYLEMGTKHRSARRDGGKGNGRGKERWSLARKLAMLHSTPPASVLSSEDEDGGQRTGQVKFGFPVTTCCGDTAQDNSYKSSWADFYANNRLRHILRKAEERNGADKELRGLLEGMVEKVVPRLLGDGHLTDFEGQAVKPVVVHGDLWSGNWGKGRILRAKEDDNKAGDNGQGGEEEEIIFDPSSSWSHSEFEFGIMRMFGGFGADFEQEYHEYKKKDKPVEEWEDRVRLYELYHHLNHYSIFGSSYCGGAVRIMTSLLHKYDK